MSSERQTKYYAANKDKILKRRRDANKLKSDAKKLQSGKVKEIMRLASDPKNLLMVKDKIYALSQDPFRDLLSKILLNAPSDTNIKDMAAKSPDRYMQMIVMIAKLAGYKDTIEIKGTIVHEIKALGVSQLHQRLQTLRADYKVVETDDVEPKQIELKEEPQYGGN